MPACSAAVTAAAARRVLPIPAGPLISRRHSATLTPSSMRPYSGSTAGTPPPTAWCANSSRARARRCSPTHPRNRSRRGAQRRRHDCVPDPRRRNVELGRPVRSHRQYAPHRTPQFCRTRWAASARLFARRPLIQLFRSRCVIGPGLGLGAQFRLALRVSGRYGRRLRADHGDRRVLLLSQQPRLIRDTARFVTCRFLRSGVTARSAGGRAQPDSELTRIGGRGSCVAMPAGVPGMTIG